MNSKTNNLIKVISYILLLVIVVNYGFDHEANPNKQQLSFYAEKLDNPCENSCEYITNYEKINTNGTLSNIYIRQKNIIRHGDGKKKSGSSNVLFIFDELSLLWCGLKSVNMFFVIYNNTSYDLYFELKHRGPPAQYCI